MTPTCDIRQGDCLELLREMPSESVQMCVTSPPYFQLRRYGDDQREMGQEPTPEIFIDNLINVFRQVKRVIKTDGVIFVNIGDSYNNSKGKRKPGDKIGGKQSTSEGSCQTGTKTVAGLKPKDLIGIPWMLAFALRSDGWFLRRDIIWWKDNPMPESANDRPTTTHEYIFMLSKSQRYYYDAEAISEPCSPSTHARVSQNVEAQIGSARANGGTKSNGAMKAVVKGKSSIGNFGVKNNPSFAGHVCLQVERRNSRSVWKFPTQGYKDAHFATFPNELPTRAILCGSRPGDTVLDPFMGSGTTGESALGLGRSCIGLDLYPDCKRMALDRTNITPGMGI